MKIDRDTPCELYSWYETRRIIAERFVVFCLASFGAFGGLLLVSGQCGGCWGGRESGFQHLESEAAHALNFPLFLTNSVSVSTLNFSSLFFFFVYDPHSSCWWLCMLHAAAGTQLHRSVAQLAVFRTCLEQPPLQDHRPWWRAADPPFGSYSTWSFCPQTPRLPPPSLILSVPLKQGKAARRGNPSLLWPRALNLTLAPKWKNVHSTTRALWCRDPLFLFLPPIEKLGEEHSAHPFVLIIHHPGACWNIIYCTRRWLTTPKLSRHAFFISPPLQT